VFILIYEGSELHIFNQLSFIVITCMGLKITIDGSYHTEKILVVAAND